MSTPDRPPAVTLEQLRMAWRHINRPGWPPTLEEALGNRSYSVCLYGIARNLHRTGMDRMTARSDEPGLPLFDHATGEP